MEFHRYDSSSVTSSSGWFDSTKKFFSKVTQEISNLTTGNPNTQIPNSEQTGAAPAGAGGYLDQFDQVLHRELQSSASAPVDYSAQYQENQYNSLGDPNTANYYPPADYSYSSAPAAYGVGSSVQSSFTAPLMAPAILPSGDSLSNNWTANESADIGLHEQIPPYQKQSYSPLQSPSIAPPVPAFPPLSAGSGSAVPYSSPPPRSGYDTPTKPSSRPGSLSSTPSATASASGPYSVAFGGGSYGQPPQFHPPVSSSPYGPVHPASSRYPPLIDPLTSPSHSGHVGAPVYSQPSNPSYSAPPAPYYSQSPASAPPVPSVSSSYSHPHAAPPPPAPSSYWAQRAQQQPVQAPIGLSGPGKSDYSDLDPKSMDFAYNNRYELAEQQRMQGYRQ